MFILNVFTFIYFNLSRVAIGLGFVVYKIFRGFLHVLWLPIKAALYAVGFCAGLGLVLGVIVFLVNGGHLHNPKPSAHPGCRGITVPAAVCLFGGKVEKVITK